MDDDLGSFSKRLLLQLLAIDVAFTFLVLFTVAKLVVLCFRLDCLCGFTLSACPLLYRALLTLAFMLPHLLLCCYPLLALLHSSNLGVDCAVLL